MLSKGNNLFLYCIHHLWSIVSQGQYDCNHNNTFIIAFTFYPLIDHPNAMQILIDRLIDELFWDLPATLWTFHLQRVAQLAISLEPEPEPAPEPAPEAALELDSDCPVIIQMKCLRWLWILLQILSLLSTTCTNYVVRLPRAGQAQLLPTHTRTQTHTHTHTRTRAWRIDRVD